MTNSKGSANKKTPLKLCNTVILVMKATFKAISINITSRFCTVLATIVLERFPVWLFALCSWPGQIRSFFSKNCIRLHFLTEN